MISHFPIFLVVVVYLVDCFGLGFFGVFLLCGFGLVGFLLFKLCTLLFSRLW